jgi:hypothetical protein
MAFLSITSIIVTYIFCDKKIKYLPLIMSTFIGLMPFAISCWLYKFDAPCMALSILASVIPFLLWSKINVKLSIKKMTLFALGIFGCLMVMWTSYQASSGIFIVMTMGMLLKTFLDKSKLRPAIGKAALCAALFVLSACFLKFGLPDLGSYRSTHIYSLSDMPVGILDNATKMLASFMSSFNAIQLILLALFVVAFVISLYIHSKRRKLMKVFDVEMGLIFVIFGIILSYGAYLVLQEPSQDARSLISIGIVIAIMGILMTRNLRKTPEKLLASPAMVLLCSFIAFALAFGNALADQERWANFRTQLLASDLSQINLNQGSTLFKGTIGESAVTTSVRERYPVVNLIMDESVYGLGNESGKPNVFGFARLGSYYGLTYIGSFDWIFTEPSDCTEVLVDNYYHTISKNDTGKLICITIR